MSVRPRSLSIPLAGWLAGSLAVTLAVGLLALSLALGTVASAQTFTRITGTGPHVDDARVSLSGAWGDYDADGDPDLYVGHIGAAFLYRNDGSESFVAVAGPPSDTTPDLANTMAAWGDYDNDGDLDLYQTVFTIDSNGSATIPMPNQLFRNDAGTFTQVPTSDDSTYTPGCSWVDYDLDGDLDLFAAGAIGSPHLLYRNDDGAFTKRTGLPFLGGAPGGVLQSWIDYDGDGDSDLYLVNHGSKNELWKNLRRETGIAELFEAARGVGRLREHRGAGPAVS